VPSWDVTGDFYFYVSGIEVRKLNVHKIRPYSNVTHCSFTEIDVIFSQSTILYTLY